MLYSELNSSSLISETSFDVLEKNRYFSKSSSEVIQIFDRSNIDSLEWPSNANAQFAKKFLVPMIKFGLPAFVENIQATMYVIKFDQFVLPLLVTDDCYTNSYVCSPYAHYILYGQEYSKLIANGSLAFLVKETLKAIGAFVKVGKINSVAYLNHWLFSVDLYPAELSKEQLAEVIQFIKNQFPSHAIVMRSLNPISTSNLIETVKDLDLKLLASRYIYLTDTQNPAIFQTRIIKSDLKLWRESPYEILNEKSIAFSECSQMLELYHLLYDYRSNFQPKVKLQLMELLFEKNLFRFKVIKENKKIIGMAGYFEKEGTMLCPLFGYEKNHAEHAKIYRLLSTSLLVEAEKNGWLFHQSAGASFYKQIRRAEGCLEYMAICIDHLPKKQKVAWSSLRLFINKIGPPFMKKY